MLKAGNVPGSLHVRAPNPFEGLVPGRIVHVCVQLPGNGGVVIRPAIVTSVIAQSQGIISAHVFKDPEDPPGEVVTVEPGRIARPMGSHLRYGTKKPPHPWTWRWVARVD